MFASRITVLGCCLLLSPLAVTATAQSIEVPAGQHIVLTVLGHGVQIYRCDQGAKATIWTFVAPEAQLYANGEQVGTHEAGPMWTYKDSSTVSAKVEATAPASTANAIPLLLLKASSSSGTGLLTQVTYITRTAPEGGSAPKQGCGSAPIGTTLRVPYAATYTFYAPGK